MQTTRVCIDRLPVFVEYCCITRSHDAHYSREEEHLIGNTVLRIRSEPKGDMLLDLET